MKHWYDTFSSPLSLSSLILFQTHCFQLAAEIGPAAAASPFSPASPLVPGLPLPPLAPLGPIFPGDPTSPWEPFTPSAPGQPRCPLDPDLPLSPRGPWGPGIPGIPGTPLAPGIPPRHRGATAWKSRRNNQWFPSRVDRIKLTPHRYRLSENSANDEWPYYFIPTVSTKILGPNKEPPNILIAGHSNFSKETQSENFAHSRALICRQFSRTLLLIFLLREKPENLPNQSKSRSVRERKNLTQDHSTSRQLANTPAQNHRRLSFSISFQNCSHPQAVRTFKLESFTYRVWFTAVRFLHKRGRVCRLLTNRRVRHTEQHQRDQHQWSAIHFGLNCSLLVEGRNWCSASLLKLL